MGGADALAYFRWPRADSVLPDAGRRGARAARRAAGAGHLSVRAGRRRRRPGAADGRPAGRRAQSFGHRREPHRLRRPHRHHGRQGRSARRIDAADHADCADVDLSAGVQDAELRSVHRLRTDLADRHQRVRDRGQSRCPREEHQGTDRMAEGQPVEGQFRRAVGRHAAAFPRRDVRARRRRRSAPRRLSRRSGFGRRPGRGPYSDGGVGNDRSRRRCTATDGCASW